MHPLFFTTPVSKFAYLGGRFTGALLVNAFILFSIPLGLMLGSVMPYLDAHRFGPFQPMAFLHPYLVLVLPNLIFTRRDLLRARRADAADDAELHGRRDDAGRLPARRQPGAGTSRTNGWPRCSIPSASCAFQFVTKYWTPAERNATLIATERRFSLQPAALARGRSRDLRRRLFPVPVCARLAREALAEEKDGRAPRMPTPPYAAPGALRRADGPAVVHAWRPGPAVPLARTPVVLEHRRQPLLLRDPRLRSAVPRSSAPIRSASCTARPPGRSPTKCVEVLGGTFAIFMLIVITFYAGDLVWRERDVQINQVQDAMPVPTWVPFAAKFTALVLMVIVLQAVILVAGVLTQAVKGYTQLRTRPVRHVALRHAARRLRAARRARDAGAGARQPQVHGPPDRGAVLRPRHVHGSAWARAQPVSVRLRRGHAPTRT